ncbi:MAG: radical SAM protein [Spirochaetes bacterium]|nr:radical SAM protein [Spirochaetota bacterium]
MIITVTEIFRSIQGETTTAGHPSVFVRCTGCNLDCTYCDTRYAREGGTPMEIEAVLAEIEGHAPFDHVTITGGEPLIQAGSIQLAKEILERGWRCQVETNGSILIKDLPEQARKIVDVKTPSSGEDDSFEMRNLKYMTDRDEIKFVISNAVDYEFSKDFIAKYLTKKGTVINFSPAAGAIPARELAERILDDRLPVRLNLQLHRIIFGPEQRGR